jgi:hypothetical protein
MLANSPVQHFDDFTGDTIRVGKVIIFKFIPDRDRVKYVAKVRYLSILGVVSFTQNLSMSATSGNNNDWPKSMSLRVLFQYPGR